MKSSTIKQTATIPASPLEVYNALMTSKGHTAVTGEKAVIGKKEGDSYSAYGGYITGKNIELVPGKKIVQTWVAMEELWPQGHESKITLELREVKGGTKINFLHEHVPAVIAKNFVSGWKDFYWTPLKEYFTAR